jgi:hypothetical protein
MKLKELAGMVRSPPSWHGSCKSVRMSTAAGAEGLRAPDAFVVPMSARTWEDAAEELLEGLCRTDLIREATPFRRALLQPAASRRSAADPTVVLAEACGPAAGIPALAFGISARGIACGPGLPAARAFFLGLCGPGSASAQAALFETIERALACPSFRDRLLGAAMLEEAAACFPPASAGRYQLVFRSLFAPLVPEIVYVTG